MSAEDQPRPLKRSLLLSLLFILALLTSLCCFMFLFAQLALSGEKEEWLKASMATSLRADYRPDEWVEMRRFAPLQAAVIEETARDEEVLSATPVTGPIPVAVAVVAITSTPFPPPNPTPVPVPTSQPSPTPQPTPTSQPSPTLQPTATGTSLPTGTVTSSPTPGPTATPTALPPTFTPTAPPPTPTSPPPTPTSPPPTPTSPPPPPPPDTPTSPPPPPPPPPPQVLAVYPIRDDNDAAVSIVITGTNFVSNPTAFLVDGGATALTTTYVSSTTLNALIPAWFTADYYDLAVTNPDLQSGTLTNAFTLTNPIPLISGIIPDNGVDNADTDVTINGNYFVNGLSAWLGGFSLSVTFVNSTTLNAKASSAIMPGGPYTLTISNPGPLTPTNSSTDAFTVTLSSTYGDPPTCITTTNCISATGPPDGNAAEIAEGGYLTFTLPAGSGIRDGAGYDFVFFEYPVSPGIYLDWLVVEISDDGVNWYEVLDWGDNITDTNTNVASYNYNGDTGEEDNEPINSADLWPGGLPLNTGVAIDINTPTWDPPPGSQYRYIRFSCPTSGGDGAQVDSILRLH